VSVTPDQDPTGAGAHPPAEEPHDETGLELARALAQGMRGRPTATSGRKRRSRTARSATELSGAHPDARDPALLGPEVDKLVSQSGWERDVAVHGVFGRWASIVGEEVAAHCTPESYDDGKLRVRTDSTAWATQLKLLVPNVVRRMNEELGHGTVLVIDVIGPDAPSWTKGRRTVRDGRGPRDTYG
jgi:predicted nucleic acid-binding Zn ribbon protein